MIKVLCSIGLHDWAYGESARVRPPDCDERDCVHCPAAQFYADGCWQYAPRGGSPSFHFSVEFHPFILSIRWGAQALTIEMYPVRVGWSLHRWRGSWKHGSAYLGRFKLIW